MQYARAGHTGRAHSVTALPAFTVTHVPPVLNLLQLQNCPGSLWNQLRLPEVLIQEAWGRAWSLAQEILV